MLKVIQVEQYIYRILSQTRSGRRKTGSAIGLKTIAKILRIIWT